jgi:tetratricopeptide (TPR) repeat protein
MQARTVQASGRIRNWGMGVLLFGLVLGCYWPALGGRLLWDDDFHVTRPELRSWAGLGRIWGDLHATKQYYPVLHSAFWIEHRLWGGATLGYHLVNVILHAASCCLLALVVRRLWTPARGAPGASVASAGRAMPAGADWLAALILVVHPVCVESVAWISEQKNTLSLLFYLLAALAYLDFHERRGPAAYWRASVFFAMALLSKSVTATLPAALLVALWWKEGRLSLRRDVLPLVPWFLAAAAAGILTSWVERRLIGAEGPAFDLSAMQRVLLAAHAVWFYLGKLLWPSGLAFTYPRWNVRAEAPGWYGYLAAALAVTAALWLVRRKARGPLAGWLLFVGSLFPVLGFFNVYPFVFSYVADHFQYLACVGMIATVAGGAAIMMARSPPQARACGWLLGAGVLAALAFRSNRECRFYGDSETLYRETLRRNPGSWMAHNNLGELLAGEGQVDAAIDHYRTALDIFPDFPGTHDNLGVALLKKGRVDEAVAQLRRAAELDPYDPMVHDNMGIAYRRKGMTADALDQFQMALAIDPADVSARFNLGQALVKAGRVDEAIAQYRKIIEGEPDSLEARLRLGSILERTGRVDEAVAQFRKAVDLSPGNADAQNDLGAAFLAGGRVDEAIACFQRALEIRPDSVDAHDNLGNALLRGGHVDDAIAEFTRALAIDPSDAATQQALGVANERKRLSQAR